MFYNVVEFEKQIEREECCGVATEKQIECAIIDNREVAGEQDKQFLYILKNERATLLDRLRSLGLLSSFLEAENGTKQEP